MTTVHDRCDEQLASYPVARTTDIGQATEVLERVLPRVPLRMRVAVEADTFDMRMNAIEVGDVTASYVRFGTVVHAVLSQTENYHVNIALSGSATIRDRTRVMRTTPRVAAVLSPGAVGDMVCDEDCAQLCLLLPATSLERELGRHIGSSPAAPIEFVPEMQLTAPSARGWLEALRLVLNTADRANGRPLHPMGARTLENLLVDSLLLTQPHNHTAVLNVPPAAASPRAVREATELLTERASHPWSVGELAESVHLSVRALQQAFNRSMGMSPMSYLRRVRLTQAHQELMSGSPEELTVREVAERWGFVHHGRFAAAYRSQFGETPKQTLRGRPE